MLYLHRLSSEGEKDELLKDRLHYEREPTIVMAALGRQNAAFRRKYFINR